ncbi:MAG: cytochrome c-type biogenesis protein [Acetobacteraceae bacterium]
MRRLFPFLAVLLVSLPAWALTPVLTPALTPAQAARAEAIGSQLRCLVCQNESVEESSATLAANIRMIIREQISAGRTNHQIMQWMTARYGDFIRLDPPFKPLTVLLWAMPVLAPLAGIGVAVSLARKRRAAPEPLSEAEKARLAALLE